MQSISTSTNPVIVVIFYWAVGFVLGLYVAFALTRTYARQPCDPFDGAYARLRLPGQGVSIMCVVNRRHRSWRRRESKAWLLGLVTTKSEGSVSNHPSLLYQYRRVVGGRGQWPAMPKARVSIDRLCVPHRPPSM